MKAVGKTISWMTEGASGIAGILIVLMVIHVFLDVLMRFIFQTPIDATILYVSVFYMIGVAFFPLGSLEAKDNHISVELLVEKLPGRLQKILSVFALLVTSVVAATVAVRTGQEALLKYSIGAYSIEASGRIITWPSYFYLPIGFSLMALVSAWKMIATVMDRENGLRVLTIEDPYLARSNHDV